MSESRQALDDVRKAGAWPVMVLAHNEEKRIVKCLDSIYEADPGRSFEVFVMANGCRDATEAIVANYARDHPGVHLVSIQLADYCNAWNVFVHDTVPKNAIESDVFFFMDGDCRACPRAFFELYEGLRQHPEANAAGAPPKAGWNREKDGRKMIDGRSFFANLYALRGSFVKRLQDGKVKFPVGLEGDDGLLGALVKWDLEPRGEWRDTRIVPCPESGFTFDPVSPFDVRVWKTYLKRLIRYGRRRYEFDLLRPLLKRDGLKALPEHISQVYGGANQLALRWQGIYTITNFLALRQMRRQARSMG
ncbi:MAG TPA: glycosyltransferase family A protein [Candidatus Binatus sp.]|nr:glycosyltransferase family A protein [Candidatus Binatus sp.]